MEQRFHLCMLRKDNDNFLKSKLNFEVIKKEGEGEQKDVKKTAGRRDKKIEFEKEDVFDREKLHNAIYKMAKDVR